MPRNGDRKAAPRPLPRGQNPDRRTAVKRSRHDPMSWEREVFGTEQWQAASDRVILKKVSSSGARPLWEVVASSEVSERMINVDCLMPHRWCDWGHRCCPEGCPCRHGLDKALLGRWESGMVPG